MPNFKDRITKTLKPSVKVPELPPGHIPNPLADYYDPDAPPLENERDKIVKRTFTSQEAVDRYLKQEGSVEAQRADVSARLVIAANHRVKDGEQ